MSGDGADSTPPAVPAETEKRYSGGSVTSTTNVRRSYQQRISTATASRGSTIQRPGSPVTNLANSSTVVKGSNSKTKAEVRISEGIVENAKKVFLSAADDGTLKSPDSAKLSTTSSRLGRSGTQSSDSSSINIGEKLPEPATSRAKKQSLLNRFSLRRNSNNNNNKNTAAEQKFSYRQTTRNMIPPDVPMPPSPVAELAEPSPIHTAGSSSRNSILTERRDSPRHSRQSTNSVTVKNTLLPSGDPAKDFSRGNTYSGLSNGSVWKDRLNWVFNLREPYIGDTEKFVTSWFVAPEILLITRGISFWWSLVILGGFVIPQADVRTFFFTFTYLSWMGLAVYFGIAVCLSANFMNANLRRTYRSGETFKPIEIVLSDKTRQNLKYPPRARFIRIAVWMLYVLPAVYQWLIQPVYWAFLSGELIEEMRPFDFFKNINIHGVGWVMMVLEMCLNRIPIPWSHFSYAVVTALFYMFWTWICHAAIINPETNQ